MGERPTWSGISEAHMALLIEAARRADLAFDARDHANWLQALQRAFDSPTEFEIAEAGSFGGHELAVIDFDPVGLDRWRRIGQLVATPHGPGIQTALAITGSAAQSRIQPFPSDLDFFERVHIDASTIEEARQILATLVRECALSVAMLPRFLLDEVFFGSCAGQPARWSPGHLLERVLHDRRLTRSTGLEWHTAARTPGFVKLDWLLLDRKLGGPAKLSKVVDATWAGPDGSVVSLDDGVDADFQQIYLDARGAELAAFLTSNLPPAIRDDYIQRLERAIARYASESPPNYAKVTKRLYNVCRLTGRHAEAAYLREMFDQPAAQTLQRLERRRLTRQYAAVGTGTDSAGEGLESENEHEVMASLNAAFQRQLHDFPPTRTLLAEIVARHGAVGLPDKRDEQPGAGAAEDEPGGIHLPVNQRGASE